MAKGTDIEIFSHWSTRLEGLTFTPSEFYKLLQQAVEDKQPDHTKISTFDWKEGSILSAKRIYLRVKRREHVFDVCFAPFGAGTFVSWWLGETQTFLLRFLSTIPFIGPMIISFIRPMTYFRIDSAHMFQSLVHSAVLEVIDSITTEKGLRKLTADERKPEMKDFFSR